jgi:hypothetical protein
MVVCVFHFLPPRFSRSVFYASAFFLFGVFFATALSSAIPSAPPVHSLKIVAMWRLRGDLGSEVVSVDGLGGKCAKQAIAKIAIPYNMPWTEKRDALG